jgi:WD40 repeat protein
MRIQNDNILKLIFTNIVQGELRNKLDQIRDTAINKVLLNILSLDKLYKSIGRSKIELDTGNQKINALAVLPNGNIVSADDCKIKIWNLKTYLCIKTFETGSTSLRCLVVHQNENIVSSSFLGVIQVWNEKVDFCIKIREVGGYGGFTQMLLLSNGKLITNAIFKDNYYVLVFDSIIDFKLIKVIESYSSKINSMVELKNNTFAYVTYQTNMKIIDTSNKYKCLNNLSILKEELLSLCYLDEYNLLITGQESCMKVWDDERYNCIEKINAYGGVNCFVKSPCKYFATYSFSHQTIKIWNMRSLKCIHVIWSQLQCGKYFVFLKDFRVAIASTNKNEKICILG